MTTFLYALEQHKAEFGGDLQPFTDPQEAHRIVTMIHELATSLDNWTGFAKGYQQARKEILEQLSRPDKDPAATADIVKEFRQMITRNRTFRETVGKLERSLDNFAPFLEKLDRQLEKDAAIIQSLGSKDAVLDPDEDGAAKDPTLPSGLSVDHPAIAAQRKALDVLQQSLRILRTDLSNLSRDADAASRGVEKAGKLARYLFGKGEDVKRANDDITRALEEIEQYFIGRGHN